MGRIRQPVGAPGWLWVLLAVAAMGFSLMHTVVDFGIFIGSSASPFGVSAAECAERADRRPVHLVGVGVRTGGWRTRLGWLA